MTSEATQASHEAAEEPQSIGEELSNKLKNLGFDPGCPIYEVSPEFEVDLVKRALFESTYTKPVLLPFEVVEYREGGIKDDWPLPMVVESVRAVYHPYIAGLNEVPTGCWEEPEWYVRGFLYKSPFDPYLQVIRMNVFIQMNQGEKGEPDIAFLQVVRNPSALNPEAPLVWGRGAPGQPL